MYFGHHLSDFFSERGIIRVTTNALRSITEVPVTHGKKLDAGFELQISNKTLPLALFYHKNRPHQNVFVQNALYENKKVCL
ncbi:MAG: hypothetical protein PHF79_02680 [Candidatus Pacebacteria bacterium]|nr:hypothetical protein [Candidatus Paceibacterota bacterium]